MTRHSATFARFGRHLALAAIVAGVFAGDGTTAQQAPATVPRILTQDPTLNNLIDPPGYTVGVLGTLGRVEKTGHGPRALILIPGLGFGGEVFETFLPAGDEEFTRYLVTLPGMGGTPAPPAPPETVSFGDQTWTRGAVRAIEALMDRDNLDDVVVVGHWLVGTQVALDLAKWHPEQVKAVVLLAGSARWVTAEPNPAQPDDLPLDQRVARVDQYMASQWFKTVTRETWDDNNFLPGDYSANPILGLRLWREAARPPLHVWVRYLNEFYAQDSTLGLEAFTTPTLLVKPGLEDLFHDPGNNYVRAYTDRGWGRWASAHGPWHVRTIPESRLVPWIDQPDLVRAAVVEFLESTAGLQVDKTE